MLVETNQNISRLQDRPKLEDREALTPHVEQEQPLQSLLQEQEEQEQGDMVSLVC